MSGKIILSQASHGTGRAIVIVYSKHSGFESSAHKLYDLLEKNGQIFLLESAKLESSWQIALDGLIQTLETNKIRNAAFIGFEDSTILLQALILKKPKLVRSLVLIDPETRDKPSFFADILRKVETFLPLGLPFRSDCEGFDGEPYLQRIRCPLLLILASLNDGFKKQQLEMMSKRAPTSFFLEIDASLADSFLENLSKTMLQFFEIPAKSPQKNLAKI